MSVVSQNYLGDFSHLSSSTRQKYFDGQLQREKIPVKRFFVERYKVLPYYMNCQSIEKNAQFHVSSILNYLQNEFGHNSKNDITRQKFHAKSKQFYAIVRLSDLENGIMIFIRLASIKKDVYNPNNYSADFINDSFLVTNSILFYYTPENDLIVRNIAKECLNFSLYSIQKAMLQLVCRSQQTGYYFVNVQIKEPLIYDLALHYGEKFVSIHKKIIQELKKKDNKGIVLLHGLPGCGKTHYIRYLIQQIQGKNMVYITPDMAKDISKPEFLTFLLTHKKSVLIIEDAENIIRDRNETKINPTQAVANLLNLSDGLLNDAMQTQIIATFNCDLTAIDRALLRKGRLIANYEFTKLNVENSKILSNKLGFPTENITNPMTLAEIYNQNNGNDDDILL